MRCVLLHPHPDRGGNQHNSVITALFEALEDSVRFDFTSSDLAHATAQAVEHLGAGPAWLVGYSFGGGIAALVDDPRVLGWFLIAPALVMADPVIGPDARPKHVLAADQDQWFPPAALDEMTSDWTSTTHDLVAGADHFLRGYEADVAGRCVAWLSARETLGHASA